MTDTAASASRIIALEVLEWDRDALDPDKVSAIAASFRETGRQINEIQVRPEGWKFRVVAGRHRCEAAQRIGLGAMRSVVLPYSTVEDKLRAELIEIDENLARRNLTLAMEAALTARRKGIYEQLHPETAHGGDRRSSRQNGDLKNDSDDKRFTEAQAEITGKSERSVQRAAARGQALGVDALSRVTNTSLDKGDELDALAKLPEEKRTPLIDRAAAGEKVSARTELKKDKRKGREHDLGDKLRALPEKKFGVILADPEWRFEPYSRDTGMDRAADNHYPTSTTDVIASRPVADLAADECVLFLWATVPMLPDALVVMREWGFEYKSQCIWIKDRTGTGYWFRNRHEILLVGTRGDVPAPAPGTQWRSAVEAPVGKHSEKPEAFYKLIEEYFPSLPKMELNARRARKGWDSWGLEAPQPEDENQDRPEPEGRVELPPIYNPHDRPPSIEFNVVGEVPIDKLREGAKRFAAEHAKRDKYEVFIVNGRSHPIDESPKADAGSNGATANEGGSHEDIADIAICQTETKETRKRGSGSGVDASSAEPGPTDAWALDIDIPDFLRRTEGLQA
jgi:N6-adenosine-specific RNA methylase IME4